MRKLFYLFPFLLLLWSFFANAQHHVSPDKSLDEEKSKLLGQVDAASSDTVISDGLSRMIDSKLHKIRQSVNSDASLSILDKEKAIRSVIYFMTELHENIHERKLEMYDISEALDSYESLLRALLHHQPFVELLRPLPPSLSTTGICLQSVQWLCLAR
jgi:hypothetical protein